MIQKYSYTDFLFFLLRNESSNSVLKEIGTQNGGQFWTDEKKQTIVKTTKISRNEDGVFKVS